MSEFEDAMHQGFSKADKAAEMAEYSARMTQLGCYACGYSSIYHPTCEHMIKGELEKCPYFKEVTT